MRSITRMLDGVLALAISLLMIGAFVAPAVAAGGSPAAGPHREQTNWAQYRFGPAHQGVNPFEVVLNTGNVGTLVEKWNRHSEDAALSSPTVSDGMVFVGAKAFDEATGAILWETRIKGGHPTAPAVMNGVVYILAYFGSYTGLYAVDEATGDRLWHTAVDALDTGLASPTVSGRSVYVAGAHGVTALKASSGSVRWRTTTPYTGDSSPTVWGGNVYVGSRGPVFALDARTGAIEWTRKSRGRVNGTIAAAHGVLYAGSDKGTVFALDAVTGSPLWSRHVGGTVWGSVAVSGDTVYAASEDGSVYALRAKSGKVLWSFASGAGIDGSPSLANGVVYVGSNRGTFYALGASTGAKLWSVTIHNAQYLSSATIENGRLFVGTYYDKHLRVYGLPDETPAN